VSTWARKGEGLGHSAREVLGVVLDRSRLHSGRSCQGLNQGEALG
jgi:hypothetical protein